MDKRVLRVIDANLNRLLEGLRVCEEIERFIVCNSQLTSGFKRLRHKVTAASKSWNINSLCLINSRDSRKDIGRPSIESELKRGNLQDIFYANIQRAKESVRVLEEFAKLDNPKTALNFKDLRYKLYQIEKEAFAGLRSIRNN